MMELGESPMKFSHLSRKLDFTVQETSRNMARLSDARLVIRNSDGTFSLTPYGEEVINLLSGYEFLSRNSEYFANHTLSALPRDPSSGIGELASCTFTNDVMLTFHYSENMRRESEEYLLYMSEQVLTALIPMEEEAVERGVSCPRMSPSPRELMRCTLAQPSSGLEQRGDTRRGACTGWTSVSECPRRRLRGSPSLLRTGSWITSTSGV